MPETVAESLSIHRGCLRLMRTDITELEVDAFVFYARHDLALGAGFGNAIAVRGGPAIQKELDELDPVETGQVVVTGAGKLKANFILHAVGPRFREPDTEGKLRTTVRNALEAAEQKGVQRIALPPMGAGFYGIPLDVCARVMAEAIASHLQGDTGIQEVTICAMDDRELKPFAAQLASMNRQAV